ncbi:MULTISPECIES: hypothetical protein [Filomicrobium]|nr:MULTISPECIES: hypothetical protein [Filomicrobium]
MITSTFIAIIGALLTGALAAVCLTLIDLRPSRKETARRERF